MISLFDATAPVETESQDNLEGSVLNEGSETTLQRRTNGDGHVVYGLRIPHEGSGSVMYQPCGGGRRILRKRLQ